MAHTLIRHEGMLALMWDHIVTADLSSAIDYHSGYRILQLHATGCITQDGITSVGWENLGHLYEWLISEGGLEPAF